MMGLMVLRYKTHVATSIAGCAITAKVFSFPFTFGFVVGVGIGSLLPDLDEPRSYAGRRVPFLSKIIKGAFGHRGVTHSILAWLLTLVLVYFYPSSFMLGLSLGYFFHIFGDYFSTAGVPLLAPLSKRRYKGPLTYRTSSKGEDAIFMLACLFLLGFLLHYRELTGELVTSTIHFYQHILETLVKLLN